MIEECLSSSICRLAMTTSLRAVKLWGGPAAYHACLPRHLARQSKEAGTLYPVAGFSFGERAVHLTCDPDIESLFYMQQQCTISFIVTLSLVSMSDTPMIGKKMNFVSGTIGCHKGAIRLPKWLQFENCILGDS